MKRRIYLTAVCVCVLAMGAMSQGALWVADGAVWSQQYGSNDNWADAGGRRYATFTTGSGQFDGNLLDGDGNPIGAIGDYLSANVGTTNNNAPAHANPGPGWAYIPTGIAWQPNMTYTIDFIVLQRAGQAVNSDVQYGLWAGLPDDDKGPGDYTALFDSGEKPGQAATRPSLGTEGLIKISSGVLANGDGIFVSALDGASAVDVTFEYTTGSDVSELDEMVFFLRTDTARIHWDSISIVAEPALRAWDPLPADGATGVDPATTTVSWKIVLDEDEQPRTDVAQHYVYLYPIQNGEPNFVEPDMYTVTELPDPLDGRVEFTLPDALDYDQTVYWQVDTSIEINGLPSGPVDPNTISGRIWTFQTQASVPVITAEPDEQAVWSDATATFSVTAESISPMVFQWYWSAEAPVFDPETGQMDPVGTPVGDPATYFPPEATDTELVTGTVENEGYYYCKVTNDSPKAVYSDVVRLGVKRQWAYWTLDWADFQGGQYLDSSGEGRHADPNIVPDAASFVDGVDPAKTNEGLDLTVEPLAAATAGTQSPVQFTDEMTLSVWVKWAGGNDEFQGIISKRDFYDGSQVADWWWQINPAGDIMNANSWVGASLDTTPPVEDEWTHLVITVTPNGANLYRNGLLDADQPAFELDNTVSQLVLGGLRVDSAGQILDAFNGVMDDIKIYNYAKDPMAVADLYYAVSETPVCLNPYELDLTFDVTGDCRVGLADFAAFAAAWLSSGLYPVQ